MKNRHCRRLLCMILMLICLISGISANASSSEEPSLTLRYITVGGFVRTWPVAFSDVWFLGDPTQYSHSLAQASLGMALSAVRDTAKELGQQDDNLISYLSDAGFSAFRSDGYSAEPSVDTVASVIGRKSLPDGTVLLAVAVCGGGYGKEWCSNLTVGSGIRHEGFESASLQVQSRVLEYLDAEELNPEETVLWISGYSRGAAVANITAADLTDFVPFRRIYAYTFATPRTTRETDIRPYPHIFNIVGGNDPVTMIPLADWGYSRYGNDLYLPAIETDSLFSEKAVSASAVAQEFTGKAFRTNPAMNHYLRTILDYLNVILPDVVSYERDMQPEIVSAFSDLSEDNLLLCLSSMISKVDFMTESQLAELRLLADYIQMIVYNLAEGNTVQMRDGSWDPSVPLADNLVHEHNYDVYLEWMFSTDDPDALFVGDADYIRLAFSGESLTIDLFDESGFVSRIGPDGVQSFALPEDYQITARPEEAGLPSLYTEQLATQTIVCLPRDRDYLVIFRSGKEEVINYVASLHTNDSVRSEMTDICSVTLPKNEIAYVFFDSGSDSVETLMSGMSDRSVPAIPGGKSYSPSVIMSFETANVFHLTLNELISIIKLMVLMFAAMLLLSPIFLIVRKIRKKERSRAMTVVMHLVWGIPLFILSELGRTALRSVPPFWAVTSFWLAMNLFLLALRGCGHDTKKPDSVRWLLVSLGMLVLSSVLIPLLPVPGYCFRFAGFIPLVLAFIQSRREKVFRHITLIGMALTLIADILLALCLAGVLPAGPADFGYPAIWLSFTLLACGMWFLKKDSVQLSGSSGESSPDTE